DAAAGDAGAAPPRPPAGRITLSAGGRSIAIEPDATGRYQPRQQDAPLWQPGESVSVSAVGAKVPAFSGTLTGPGDVDITSPLVVPGQATMVRRDADVVVIWTGGMAGE